MNSSETEFEEEDCNEYLKKNEDVDANVIEHRKFKMNILQKY